MPPPRTLLDSSRDFRAHEMFFSRTNLKGQIQAGNAVFTRISGYSEAELLGQPHSIVRHPDMPRAVFRLVWEYLGQGRTVAGYVKNLAADGRYYWVVALMAPEEGGYLSVRFKPTSPLLATVEALYREMCAVEADARSRGLDGKAGMALATEKLLTGLTSLGFADYEAFMAEMLQQELTARDAAIAREPFPLVPAWTRPPDEHGFMAIYRSGHDAYRQIDILQRELADYLRLNDRQQAQLGRITSLIQEFRRVSMNAGIKAAQLGADGRCIGVVATYLGATAGHLSTTCDGLTVQMRPLPRALRSTLFALTTARLQIEMIMLFCHELGHEQSDRHTDAEVDAFLAVFDGTIRALNREIQGMEVMLKGIGGSSEEIAKLTVITQVAQVTGLIEASRLRTDDSLTQTFQDLRGQTAENSAELAQLQESIERFAFLSHEAPVLVGRIVAAIQVIKVQRTRAKQGTALPVAPADATATHGGPGHNRPDAASVASVTFCGHRATADQPAVLAV